ncbi:accessory Sec system protein Asp3 [Butyrivibrio sp. NC2007]|uniref:accessory Sec system protein Asp3 n=1 Tax=Butyrivibrio sp. NC2007 TaxID=1280683 RepID=UPI0003B4AE24|nr:accessory Sec system protein Asp3 [Butyrivibrio sp. NC2007]
MKAENSIIYSVRWDNLASDSYLYGSSIVFEPDGTVNFSNLLMPPGSVIRKWQSDLNYQAKRHEPQLPILEEGEKYEIRSYVRYKPEGSVKLRFRFLDRQGEEAGIVFIDDSTAELECPKGAFAYDLELINAGAKELIFHHIEIQKKSKAEKNVRIIDPDACLYIIVLEPTGSSYILPRERILLRFRNRVILTCEGADAIALNSSVIDGLQLDTRQEEIAVIGYGEKSNESAAIFANRLGKNVKLYTYGSSSRKLKGRLENIVYGENKGQKNDLVKSLMDPLSDKTGRLFKGKFT